MFGTPDGRKLLTLRIIWAALLVGQVSLFLVATMVTRQHAVASSLSEDARRTLFAVSGGMLVLCGVIAIVVKLVTAGSPSMQRYAAGTILYLALLEAPSLVALVLYMISGGWTAPLAVSGIAIVLQLAGFPRRTLEV